MPTRQIMKTPRVLGSSYAFTHYSDWAFSPSFDTVNSATFPHHVSSGLISKMQSEYTLSGPCPLLLLQVCVVMMLLSPLYYRFGIREREKRGKE